MIITAYIAVNGNDQTGNVGDPKLPFKTVVAAQTALDAFKDREGVVTKIIDLAYVAPSSPQ